MCATITKLEAAHRQLITAIRMYLADGDAVAVHTLACAAREIYEKHCANLQLDRLFDYIKASHPEHKATDLWNVLNGARNFFKHQGESLDEAIELRDADNKHMLFIACHDCAMLCREDQPAEVQAFNMWFIATEFPRGMEGEQADVAEEVMSRLDAKFPGLRTAPLTEQKLAGLRLLDEAAGSTSSSDLGKAVMHAWNIVHGLKKRRLSLASVSGVFESASGGWRLRPSFAPRCSAQ